MAALPFSVTVIIPVYNGAAFLAEAVDSVQRQNYQPLEIVIVDDGSTDGTAEIAANFTGNVRYVYQPNQGAPTARNQGLKMANGTVISFLDADDVWHEKKLALQLEYLSRNPSIEIVVGYSQLLIPSASPLDFNPFGDPWLFLNLASAVYRKSVFNTIGLFDPELPCSDDLDWFMRARESKVQLKVHKDVVLFHRRHNKNLTNQKELEKSDNLRMLKKMLTRRRKGKDGGVTLLPRFSDYAENSASKAESNRDLKGYWGQ